MCLNVHYVYAGMRYVISESGDLHSTGSREGSCDTKSTKDNSDSVTTTATDGKGIEEITCEPVNVAIQNAITELRNEVWSKIIQICECIRMLIC